MSSLITGLVMLAVSGCVEQDHAHVADEVINVVPQSDLDACFVLANEAETTAPADLLRRYIRLRVYSIVKNSSPEPESIVPFLMDRGVTEANQYFEAAGIQFFVADDIEYLDIDQPPTLQELFEDPSLRETLQIPTTHDDAINVIIVNSNPFVQDDEIKAAGFWAPDMGAIFLPLNAGTKTFAHELGHSMGLPHTFETDSTCPEGLSGDCIDDTPFDPGTDSFPDDFDCEWVSATCSYECSDIVPPDFLNLMSYYYPEDPNCAEHFTPGQSRFMYCMATQSDISRMTEDSYERPDGFFDEHTVQLPCNVTIEEWKTIFTETMLMGPNGKFIFCGDNNNTGHIRIFPGSTTYGQSPSVAFEGTGDDTIIDLAEPDTYTNINIVDSDSNLSVSFSNLTLVANGTTMLNAQGGAEVNLTDVQIGADTETISLMQATSGSEINLDSVSIADGAQLYELATISGGRISGTNLDVGELTTVGPTGTFSMRLNHSDFNDSSFDIDGFMFATPLDLVLINFDTGEFAEYDIDVPDEPFATFSCNTADLECVTDPPLASDDE